MTIVDLLSLEEPLDDTDINISLFGEIMTIKKEDVPNIIKIMKNGPSGE